MGFEDYATAAQFREVMENIAKGVVNRERPDAIVGKVYEINRAQQKAWVLLPGETVENVIAVRFALDKIPTSTMRDTFDTLGYDAPGDIVRVSGKSGSYFILDFMFGTPEGVGGTGGGSGTRIQQFNFPTPTNPWVCNHTLNTTAVLVGTYDEFGAEIRGDVAIIDANTVQVSWGGAENGSVTIQG